MTSWAGFFTWSGTARPLHQLCREHWWLNGIVIPYNITSYIFGKVDTSYKLSRNFYLEWKSTPIAPVCREPFRGEWNFHPIYYTSSYMSVQGCIGQGRQRVKLFFWMIFFITDDTQKVQYFMNCNCWKKIYSYRCSLVPMLAVDVDVICGIICCAHLRFSP